MASTQQQDALKPIVSHAKEYGYIFSSSEIYDGLSAVYDYGPYGVELKNNIRSYWWKSMVQMHENVVGLDAAIFMHPEIWKASGHVDAFNDPLIDNKDSKKRYRADQLIEDYLEKYRKKISKDTEKARKRFGAEFDEAQFLATNPNVLRNKAKIEEINFRMNEALNKEDFAALKALIEELGIADPETGSKNWTDVRMFNLMFSTQLGTIAGEAGKLYLRPETAQGIFVNFLNVLKSTRQKIPFGIAQTGKAFRNEIVARQFIFRMREFEQMEMQFFIRPGEEEKWYAYWKEKRMKWHKTLYYRDIKINKTHQPSFDQILRFHKHEKLAHYARAAVDIEFRFPFGFRELEGIHSRGDFDLVRHQEFSGKKLRYFDPELDSSYVPSVVETSIGLDRMFLAVFSRALDEEILEDGSQRTVLRLPAELAPVKVAVLPLLKKDGLPEEARQIFDRLKLEFMCQYDEKDAIGKRYRRQDAIGTPYCLTVDHQTLEDMTLTIRERDSMKQERIPLERVREVVKEKVQMENLLRQL